MPTFEETLNLEPQAHHRLLALAAAVVLAAACGGSPTDPAPDDLVIPEMILVGDDGEIAYSHIDHWHGAPVVWVGEDAHFTLHFSSVRLPPDERRHRRDAYLDDASGTMTETPNGSGRFTEVVLRPTVTLREGDDAAKLLTANPVASRLRRVPKRDSPARSRPGW